MTKPAATAASNTRTVESQSRGASCRVSPLRRCWLVRPRPGVVAYVIQGPCDSLHSGQVICDEADYALGRSRADPPRAQRSRQKLTALSEVGPPPARKIDARFDARVDVARTYEHQAT